MFIQGVKQHGLLDPFVLCQSVVLLLWRHFLCNGLEGCLLCFSLCHRYCQEHYCRRHFLLSTFVCVYSSSLFCCVFSPELNRVLLHFKFRTNPISHSETFSNFHRNRKCLYWKCNQSSGVKASSLVKGSTGWDQPPILKRCVMVESRERKFNQCVVKRKNKGLGVPESVFRGLTKALGLNTGRIWAREEMLYYYAVLFKVCSWEHCSKCLSSDSAKCSEGIFINVIVWGESIYFFQDDYFWSRVMPSHCG